MASCGSALRLALMAGASVASVQAMAQTGSGGASSQIGAAPIDEIVVTANRRAENIQKVPLSVAVLQSDTLMSSGVTNATQLQIATTNVQIGNLNNNPLIYIRGMGSSNLGPGTETPVGVYQDGVYLPWGKAVEGSFIDVERVEVLKGPQGTLYGRNTTAGAINFITKDPSTARVVEGQASLGTWNTRQLQAYVATGPGNIAASIAANYIHHGHYMKNLADGPDFENRNDWGVRGKVKFELSEDWVAMAAVGYSKRKDRAGSAFLSLTDRPTAADPAQGGNFTTMKNPRRTYTDFDSFGNRNAVFGATLDLRGDLGFADFVSISGFGRVTTNQSPDNDASDRPLSGFSSRAYLNNWSQELQLASKSDSEVKWIAGLYAFRSKGGFSSVEVFLPGNTGAPMCCKAVRVDSGSSADIIVASLAKAMAYAAYGQITYPILDGLSLTGGLRYSRERRTLLQSDVIAPGFGVVASDPREGVTFDSLDPKAGIEYSWGAQMLYGSFTRGFRSGGYNIGSPGAIGPVKPEKVSAFEIGGKHTLIPGLNFNWSAFRYKYKDLQVSIVQNDGAGSLFTTQNAASATSKGIEAEFSINAFPRLSVHLGGAYLDAKYTKYQDASAYLPTILPNGQPGYGFTQQIVDVSGRPLTRAPKWTATMQATYALPLGDTRHLDFSGNLYYTSKYYLDTPSNILQDKYAILNLRATLYLMDDRVSLGVFANNVTNKAFLMSHSTTNYAISVTPSDPRIIGGTVGFKF